MQESMNYQVIDSHMHTPVIKVIVALIFDDFETETKQTITNYMFCNTFQFRCLQK